MWITDDIITRNPRPELTGYHDEMLNAQIVLHITFLQDVLTIMNILSLVLQSDRKDFGAVRHALSTTLTTLNDMQNSSSVNLKGFCAYQDVLSQIKLFAKQNILVKHTRKKLRINHLISIEEFHENIGQVMLKLTNIVTAGI